MDPVRPRTEDRLQDPLRRGGKRMNGTPKSRRSGTALSAGRRSVSLNSRTVNWKTVSSKTVSSKTVNSRNVSLKNGKMMNAMSFWMNLNCDLLAAFSISFSFIETPADSLDPVALIRC